MKEFDFKKLNIYLIIGLTVAFVIGAIILLATSVSQEDNADCANENPPLVCLRDDYKLD